MATGNVSTASIGAVVDEGVLRDVLDELDRERARRAELEAQMRKLSDELAAERAKPKATLTQLKAEADQVISRKAFVAMETQVEGFKQLVDALTLGKPAIAAAAQASSSPRKRAQTLPLHVVRLLEVMPWDRRAQEYIFAQEEVFEWQIYDVRENKWQSNLRFFPIQFKSLPVVKATGNQIQDSGNTNKDKSLLVFLAGGDKHSSSPSKYGVLTSDKLTQMYKIEDGYPLPQDGGQWEWIGGWRIDKSVKPSEVCDKNGWSYGVDTQSFVSLQGAALSDRRDSDDKIFRNIRRRRWTRRRVLVDYPLSSERTRQYLKLLVENAQLAVTAAKLSEQLVQTKTALTESEGRISGVPVASEKQVESSEAVVRAIEPVVNGKAEPESTNPLQDFLSKNEQVKELGSKITQWVKSARKTSEDLTGVDNGDDGDTKAQDDSQKFPWKKLGRGALMEKLGRATPAKTLHRSHSATSLETKTTVTSTDEVKVVQEEL